VPLEQTLRQGAEAMGLALDRGCVERLLAYLRLLEKWNRTYNLTAVRDPADMVARHLLDSLAVLPELAGPEVLDIGTGPGLPGIPLALARPDLEFTLLDSNLKMLRFVRQALHELHIKNAAAVQARVEAFRPGKIFATLIARAFASIPDMLIACGHLAAPGSRILAMKGAYPQQELAAVPPSYRVVEVKALRVPGLDAERHLVVITPRGEE
jgi:16S rRNA (guanine527-N7)-methyltransferase